MKREVMKRFILAIVALAPLILYVVSSWWLPSLPGSWTRVVTDPDFPDRAGLALLAFVATWSLLEYTRARTRAQANIAASMITAVMLLLLVEVLSRKEPQFIGAWQIAINLLSWLLAILIVWSLMMNSLARASGGLEKRND